MSVRYVVRGESSFLGHSIFNVTLFSVIWCPSDRFSCTWRTGIVKFYLHMIFDALDSQNFVFKRFSQLWSDEFWIWDSFLESGGTSFGLYKIFNWIFNQILVSRKFQYTIKPNFGLQKVFDGILVLRRIYRLWSLG